MDSYNTDDATVIIGAGIIGTSVAYYLSRKSSKSIHLIESSPELFASASGYAAGFLARDWFSRPLSKLGALSFDLHRQLANQHDGFEQWGYCPSTAGSLEETVGNHGDDWLGEGLSRVRAAAKQQTNGGEELNCDVPPWLKLNDQSKLDIISRGDTTAQVDPRRLCDFLLRECQSRGVRMHHPVRIAQVTRAKSCEATYNVKFEHLKPKPDEPVEETVSCMNLIIAAGAWTPQVFQMLFPRTKIEIPISSLAGHSLLLKSSRWPPPPSLAPNSAMTATNGANKVSPKTPEPPACHALFSTSLATSTPYSPEIFSRFSLPPISSESPSSPPLSAEGYVYLAGLNSPIYPLPSDPTQSALDPSSISTLHTTADQLLGSGSYEVVRESVCWRPVVSAKRRGGTPVIGCLEAVMGEEGRGCWVAAGHGAWGISLSLGTGYCVAESILQGRVVDDIQGLGL